MFKLLLCVNVWSRSQFKNYCILILNFFFLPLCFNFSTFRQSCAKQLARLRAAGSLQLAFSAAGELSVSISLYRIVSLSFQC